MKVVYAKTNTHISSDIVQCAHELNDLVGELVANDDRLDLLVKLVRMALADIYEKMPGGADAIDLLMAADAISSWALKELATNSQMAEDTMRKGWIMAQAIRTGLLPAPTLAETTAVMRRGHDKPS